MSSHSAPKHEDKPKKEEKHEGKGESKEEKKELPSWKSYPFEVKATKTYDWKGVHADMEAHKYAGTYGGSHSAWHALAALRAKVDLTTFHAKRSPDEFYVPELHEHLQRPETQARWSEIATMDPMGMYAEKTAPTISATTAKMDIPEIKGTMHRDGRVVDDGGLINVIKCSIDYVWNIPAVAERLGMDEKAVREALKKYTGQPDIADPKFKAYLPPIGGVTVYFIGDVRKMHLKTTKIAVRTHDACCGSDVFGTDICTCRPYLIYAVQQAVEVAQEGGVGLIIYYMKEGRSLGEVTKFRVYNARKAQKGGDTAENYFYVTESIAGIRDARFQELMPDPLLWLGVDRIDDLLSMSADKYDGITGMGVKVMQRRSLPDMYVPKGATVELTAKVASGYHTESIKTEEVLQELRSLEAIRTRCNLIYARAKKGECKHFIYDPSKMPDVIKYVLAVTKKNYPTLDIPYHSRWRHFDEKEIAGLVASWPKGDSKDAGSVREAQKEVVRRKIDLVTISVLLDAGAGTSWVYTDAKGVGWSRSEGIAISSLDMFKEGYFSSDSAIPHRVNARGLKALSLERLKTGFQIGPRNPMIGINGRYGLLHRLGDALMAHPEFFGTEVFRPGHLVDYLLRHASDDGKVSIKVLWHAVVNGYESIWPDNLTGVRRGDVHVFTDLRKIGVAASDMIPFHKLSQWLTYSLLEPLESLGLKFTDLHLLTGLAEYRNGGLFVDLGVLTPKDQKTPELNIGSEPVVEWRALTICLLDEVAVGMRAALGKTEDQLPLARVLQGGTWAAGRQIASDMRPDNPRQSPILVKSDGTVF